MSEAISIAVRFERMRTALTAKPQSFKDLQAVSGLHLTTVRRWIDDMRSVSPRRVYIADFKEDERGRPVVLMFAWDEKGTKKDAERPGPDPKGPAKRMQRMRARRKEAT